MTILHMQINSPPPPIPGVPGAVQAVMDRALTKKPEDRYQTSREMAVDFYLAIGMTAQAETIREALPAHIAPQCAIVSAAHFGGWNVGAITRLD